MTTETQSFVEAEKAASELVEALSALRQEAISYQTAAGNLDAVRANLVALIDTTAELAKGTHKSVESLVQIGGPQILSSIDGVSEKVTAQTDSINARIGELAKTTSTQAESVTKTIAGLRALLLCTLGVSILALIVGILAFIK